MVWNTAISKHSDTHVKVVNRFSDIELVHSWNDYGWSGKKKQHNKKKEINAKPSKPPFETMHWKIIPAKKRKRQKQTDKYIYM